MPEAFDRVLDVARDVLEKWNVPGAAVGVIRGADLVHAAGIGARDLGRDLPMTPHTLLPIASCTKAFTAHTLGSLVDDGLLDWHEPVVRYLPGFALDDADGGREVTLLDMLTHRTGLPTHDKVGFNDQRMSARELLARLPHLRLSARRGERWQYSNLMYAVAGYATEVVTGQSWASLVSERVLVPLGMSRSGVSAARAQEDPDVSRPHRRIGGRAVEVDFREVGLNAPAGALIASVAEMTRWVAVNLGEGAVGGSRILSEETSRLLHTSHIDIAGRPGEPGWVGYAAGWFARVADGHRVLHHTGGGWGFSSEVTLFPDDDLGIVVLANSMQIEPVQFLSARLADAMLDREPTVDVPIPVDPWPGMERSFEDAATLAETGESLRPYVGAFEDPGYGMLRVVDAGGRLEVVFNSLDPRLERRVHAPLERRGDDAFVSGADSHPALVPGSRYDFTRGEDGEVASLTIALEPSVAPIVFRRRP